ncbi:alpha/beta hydrolase [Glaciibacter psychrotolerans]|uniref:Acetyl esterase n=1 Tax=Glaciibacter psychrotolerans TaxID=670054 RepID=A0A7Z0J6K3_9MICO|nr:alpha/beta hydrolase [Leifsonia psychrotolerans]NYJ20480.1 acetyl esterase [Leifsonia psychrotolerans]
MTETERMLDRLNEGFPDLARLSPLAARAAVDARVRPAENFADAVTRDLDIPGPAGRIRVRVYRPTQLRQPAHRSGLVTVFSHGGGFLHGSIASHDSFCRSWAKHTAAVVVSVETRLAPEHGAPAGAEDVVATVEWLLTTGLGRRVVLAGDSSGANVAAVAALMLRDRGQTALAGQVLLYPFLDPTMSSDSHTTRAEGFFVTARTLGFYWRNYLESSALPQTDWRINPTHAADHRGLPPTILVTAGLDPLSDEGRTYAQKLRASGVPVLLRHHPDQFHGFLTIGDFGPARAARELLWSDFHHLFIRNSEDIT